MAGTVGGAGAGCTAGAPVPLAGAALPSAMLCRTVWPPL